MFQSSCSELLVDTKIKDVDKAYKHFKEVTKSNNWKTSPPLTKELLYELKKKEIKKYKLDEAERYKEAEYIKSPNISIISKDGSSASLEFGSNGYTYLGFYIDAHGDYKQSAFSILRGFEDEGKSVRTFDGGSKSAYEDWKL